MGDFSPVHENIHTLSPTERINERVENLTLFALSNCWDPEVRADLRWEEYGLSTNLLLPMPEPPLISQVFKRAYRGAVDKNAALMPVGEGDGPRSQMYPLLWAGLREATFC